MKNYRSEYVFTNVRPNDYKSHREGGSDNCGDCTTRSLCYCLNGAMTYREIEDEQYRLAKVRSTRRNTTGTWDKILTQRGFSWVQLDNAVIRDKIAYYLSFIDSPMVTLSRTHTCAIHKGKVIDTWDSRAGRVYGVLVKNEVITDVIKRLCDMGIGCTEVDLPKYKVNHRRRYSWFC